MKRWQALIVVELLLCGCQPLDAAFHCGSDAICVAPGVAGRCETTGFCSFPDNACSSGWRYGSYSGSLAGQCVTPPMDSGADGNLQGGLLAISPSIANTGHTITLEGTFPMSSITVHFPGGVDVPATLLGPHRATAIVPAGATAGDLTVTTGGATLGPLPFRRASFALGIGQFFKTHEQVAYARSAPATTTRRKYGAAI